VGREYNMDGKRASELYDLGIMRMDEGGLG
jgi:hypothetical protein